MSDTSKKRGSYKELMVWRRSIEFVVMIYNITKVFPKDEIYTLTSQMHRSAISIPSNIAEGHSRGSKKEFKHFLRIAYASGNELETQLLISEKLGYVSKKEFEIKSKELNEILSMLIGLIKTLN